MTATPVPVPSLLDAIGAADRDAALAQERARIEATEAYWLTVNAISNGNETGGTDPGRFRAVLATLGLTRADVERDVAQIRSIRETEVRLDAAAKKLEDAEATHLKAAQELGIAVAAVEAADRAARQAGGRVGDARQAIANAEAALKGARETASALVERGFAGATTLLRPPPPPPPLRKVRYIGTGEVLCGRFRSRGDVFEIERHVAVDPTTMTLFDPAVPWPPVPVRRRLRSFTTFRSDELGSHRAGEEFVAEVVPGEPLPYGVSVIGDAPEPDPAPAVAEAAPVETSVEPAPVPDVQPEGDDDSYQFGHEEESQE